MVSPEFLKIDGSLGEGGGQVLRSSLALSLITGKPFEINNIRANRKKSGLMRQHLTAVNAAMEIGDATVTGNSIGSTKVTFEPATIKPGNYAFDIGTAGSCTLVLQAILPPLIIADKPSIINLKGGTHNPFAPPFDFLEKVFLPLVCKMGPEISIHLERPGFYPAGGGEMTINITPCKHLEPLHLHNRGNILYKKAIAKVANIKESIARRELKTLAYKLELTDEELHFENIENSMGPGNVVLLEICSEACTEIFTGFGQKGVTAEKVATKVARSALKYLRQPVVAGKYLADQLLIPLAMAGGGIFSTLLPSNHTTTNMEIIKGFLDVHFITKMNTDQYCEIEIKKGKLKKSSNTTNYIKNEEQYRVPIQSWCAEVEEQAMTQAEDLARHSVVYHHVALMPDCHPGYGMPIGGVIACIDAVIPNAVGVDIGCGMGAVKTNIPVSETTREKLRALTIRIKELIPCGEGKSHKKARFWEGFDEILENLKEREWCSKHVRELATKNLGTLGGGNHFIEVQAGDDNYIWLMIHSGSRHLGNMIAKYYNQLALSLNIMWRSDISSKDLAFLPVESSYGKAYIDDMNLALSYAKENRRQIMENFMIAFNEIFPMAEFEVPINIHHNYAAIEHHFGKNVWVHRKGATRARKDEIGIIPGSMGTPSFIVKGLGNPDSFTSCSHGAGRVLGRKEASRTLTPEECDKKMGNVVYDRWNKIRRGKKSKGLYDLGEAPQAYKDIHAVIEAQRDLIMPLVTLRPLAVVKG
ncbi:protein belonging to Uncharacterized protein family UPF0027 [Candidatus Magnetomorum sp. HK-1]|nr:protein belonging to Uncharacterized protein family UPF0027 [Candidatus Magnetomorum sp. HK-1]